MKDYVFFDLDGTLTDSRPGIFESLQEVFSAFGIKKTEQEMIPFLGPSLWDSLPEYCGFSHEQCVEAVEIFRKHYNEKGIFNNRVYEGIVPLLEKLKNGKKHIVLATGKPEPQANIVLNHFDLRKYFDFVGAATLDKTRSKKAQVIDFAIKSCGLSEKDRKRIIMVGDRDNDIKGAHENGIKVAAVLYGYGSKEEFELNRADYICETTADLQKLLLRADL